MRKFLSKVKSRLTATDNRNLPSDRNSQLVRILDEGLGHVRSFNEKKPVDALGNPLPWFTYPSIEYLQQLDLSTCTVLEWGIGNSTRFFATRTKHILSVEHDEKWFELIAADLPFNAQPILVAQEDYDSYPLSKKAKYDIIIIDGIKRAECIKVALQLVTGSGLLIFDNSDRNPELCSLIRNNDFIQVDFHGFGPINSYTWTTSLFFTRKFNLKPLSFQPLIPAGGGF